MAACLLVVMSSAVQAGSYTLDSQDVGLVGAVDQVALAEGELLLDVARRHNLGYEELQLANADIDLLLPAVGQTVTLPGQHILPSVERRGIVLNLAERRLYYFPDAVSGQARTVFTYPVGIGRKEWPTPLGPTRIVGKVVKPTWYPPMSVRIEHAAKGDPLPSVVPPGPENPLGEFALLLDKPGYLIHGTNKPGGIGLRVSHGCIRLYPEDIADLFQRVRRGTPVRIVDQPVKAAVHRGRLYLEVNPPDGLVVPDKALPGLIR
ncbi:MAG: L,D-transpeptidase family protein, partial [Oceanisphaera sp.]|nr:L,D-transpeptidase family protein [Oceanisphaera sp.]